MFTWILHPLSIYPIKIRTTSTCPFLHASINPVRPSSSLALKSTCIFSELSSNSLTMFSLPSLHAHINEVSPSGDLTFRSIL
eukprot:03010.XXX_97546_97791_1 [CDS] Oithona nana genome sequencing.